MSYGSTGLGGCNLDNITPNLDWLGNNGAFFTNAHTTVGLCQPSRSVWMTGLYPWTNGATGFNPIFNHVKTFIELIKNKYSTGIIGKAEHLSPQKNLTGILELMVIQIFVNTEKKQNHSMNYQNVFLKMQKNIFFND